MTTKHAPDAVALASLALLKSNARTISDVEYWVQENLPFFGITRPVSNESVLISLSYSCLDGLYGSNWQEKLCPGELSIRVEYQAEDGGDISAFASATARKTLFKKEIDLTLAYAEWPLLTAGIALGCLQGQFDISQNEMAALHSILDEFIPLHFPSMTWPTLQGLHAADLLPVDSLQYLDTHGVREMLFSKRTPVQEVFLPNTLNP